MTKREFIEALQSMDDDAEIYFWNFNHDCWRKAVPYMFGLTKYPNFDEGGNVIKNFIGIE